MSKRVADVLVETLAAAGVRTCYGIVGDTLNRIAHAIDRSEIDWVHMRHEEAGAFAASLHIRIIKRYQAFTTLATGNFGLSIPLRGRRTFNAFRPFFRLAVSG
jgi:thiamine pyrophosphate-dependent acetolactate synthase large subunit-like protein